MKSVREFHCFNLWPATERANPDSKPRNSAREGMSYSPTREIDCFCERDKQFQYECRRVDAQKLDKHRLDEALPLHLRRSQKMVCGGNTRFGNEALTVNIGSLTT